MLDKATEKRMLATLQVSTCKLCYRRVQDRCPMFLIPYSFFVLKESQQQSCPCLAGTASLILTDLLRIIRLQ